MLLSMLDLIGEKVIEFRVFIFEISICLICVRIIVSLYIENGS